MTDSRAAFGSDRLPWLTDEPAPKRPGRRSGTRNIWAPAAAALLMVAGASYWLGTRSAGNDQPVATAPALHEALPPAAPERSPDEQVAIAPQPEVHEAPAPEVRSAPQRDVRIERPRAIKRVVVENPEAPPEESAVTNTKSAVAAKPATPAAEQPLKAWPASRSQGADGRIVRIGAFANRQQAKLGWRYMVRAYPAVAHLKATVVGDTNSRGRHFYRFQIGTTSQAHSEVLCQRMERIRLSCAVVGLPWKPRGVER
jgi:outer membrane biosynthesis protein TonB